MADSHFLDTDPVVGLPSAEAQIRLAQFGPNILVPKSPWDTLRHWLKTLADPMVMLLLVAAAVYFALGANRDGWVLVGSIAPILLVDIVLEARTGRALKKIRELTQPVSQVLRDGQEKRIPAEELVPGDILIIKEGDILPVDGLLVEANNVEMDEAALTGESTPVPKQSADPEKAEVFAGTSVLSGQGKAVITATGARTRYGQIGHRMAEVEEERTPLQRKIGYLVTRLGLGALFVCLLLLAIELARGSGWGQALISAVSLAIAAIPEELPIVFTLYLTMGVFRLARKKALVRRMVGVETLGATTVICSDKTGTLTEGKLAVAEHSESRDERLFWETVVMACEPNPTDHLERVLVEHAKEQGVSPEKIFGEWKLIRDYPFEPKNKYMSHLWQGPAGELVICAKGAMEGISARCQVDESHVCWMREQNEKLAAAGMRVIAVAGGKLVRLAESREENELSLVCLGLVGFRDPPRPEIARSLAECREAGIRVVMVTGDHPLTAHHIAEAVGLEHEDDQIVTGRELEALDDAGFSRRAQRANIFARVMPTDKYRLVQALKRQREVVAMTGDGINDALALKEAHIGVAMGRRGTEVARLAATMVLLDDNFQTIVVAVREGRQIFAKIEKAFRYLITFHIPIIFLAIAVPLLNLPLLLLPVIIIWLELIMHPTVALVFETDPGDPQVMQKPPRDPERPILTGGELRTAVLNGLSIGLAILLLYWYELKTDTPAPEARAVAVSSLILVELFLVAWELCRQGWLGLLQNRFFWLTRILILAVLLLFIYNPPMAKAMQMAPIYLHDWIEALVVALFSTFWVEAILYWRRKTNKAGP